MRILDFLEKENRLVSVSYMVTTLGIEYYSCLNGLAFLEAMDKVQKIPSNHSIFYIIKKAGVIQNAIPS